MIPDWVRKRVERARCLGRTRCVTHAAAMRVLATAERLPIIVTVTRDSNSHRQRMFSDANLL